LFDQGNIGKVPKKDRNTDFPEKEIRVGSIVSSSNSRIFSFGILSEAQPFDRYNAF